MISTISANRFSSEWGIYIIILTEPLFFAIQKKKNQH